MKAKKKIVLGVSAILIISFLVLLVTPGSPLKIYCTKWAWKECTLEHTEYNYCPVYEDVYYYQDCAKCGTRTVIDSSRTITTATAGMLPCPCDCTYCFYLGGTKWDGCTTKQDQNKPIGFQYECIQSHSECKSCTIREYVGDEVCGSIRICDVWETKTGATVPSDGINPTCIESFDTCGDGICDPNEGETESNCAVDCYVRVCNYGDVKCESGAEYTCPLTEKNWEFTRTCEYGCKGDSCCVPNWQVTSDWSECYNGLKTQVESDGCGNTRTNEEQCFSPIIGDLTEEQTIIFVVSIIIIISAVYILWRRR